MDQPVRRPTVCPGGIFLIAAKALRTAGARLPRDSPLSRVTENSAAAARPDHLDANYRRVPDPDELDR